MPERKYRKRKYTKNRKSNDNESASVNSLGTGIFSSLKRKILPLCRHVVALGFEGQQRYREAPRGG